MSETGIEQKYIKDAFAMATLVESLGTNNIMTSFPILLLQTILQKIGKTV